MNINTIIEPLNVDNWLKICELSVPQEQKQMFPIGNAYWIGISRYEEHFNEGTSKHPAQVVSSTDIFPQGYFMLKDYRVIGWTGLHEKEVVSFEYLVEAFLIKALRLLSAPSGLPVLTVYLRVNRCSSSIILFAIARITGTATEFPNCL